MFDPLNQNGDDEIDFSEKNLFEGLPVMRFAKIQSISRRRNSKSPKKEKKKKKKKKKRYPII